MTARVRDGVFFDAPTALPRGPHRLTREEVVAAQCERLMVAMTELMADRGYDRVRVGDLAERAGVSRAAFYECFADKEACAFAAYDRFIEVLLGRVAASLDPTQGAERYTAGVLEGYLGTLDDDTVVARAFQVQMDGVGVKARIRRRQALEPFAHVIRDHHRLLAEQDTTMRPLPDAAYLTIIYGIRQIACDALDEQQEPDLRALVPDLVETVLAAFRGGGASSDDANGQRPGATTSG